MRSRLKAGVLSLCPSVTLVNHAHTVQNLEIRFNHTIEGCFKFLDAKFHISEFGGFAPSECVKRASKSKNLTNNPQSLENGARWDIR